MLKMRVRDFKAFLKQKIDETDKAKIPEWDKAERYNTLIEVSELELLDECFEDYDTVWLIERAKAKRAEANYYMDVNHSKNQEIMEKLSKLKSHIKDLEHTKKSYSLIDISEEFVEREVQEVQEELKVELNEAKEEEGRYLADLKDYEYAKRQVYILHRLEGILMNPGGYFNYLKKGA